MVQHELGLLSAYFDKIGLPQLLANIKYYEMIDFDVNELSELFNVDLKNECVKKIIKTPDIKELSKVYILYGCDDHSNLHKIQYFCDLGWELSADLKKLLDKPDDIINNGSEEENKNLKKALDLYYSMSQAKEDIRMYYSTSMVNVLNKLEYMSMQFHTKLADEEVVYQSLHQLYLAIVKSLYVLIANTNKKQPDKFYTNVVWLYKVGQIGIKIR